MLSTLRNRRLLWPGLMTLAGIVVTLSLAHWQWQRRAWKNELIATIEARTSIAPLPPEAWANLKCRTVEEVGLELSCEYMKLTLRGTFDHARERHVFINVPRQPNGIGGPGYWVFTPMRLSQGPAWIYVNRGFVPGTMKEPARRPQSPPAGEIEIIGQLRSAEPRFWFTAGNDPKSNIWYARNPAEFEGSKPDEVGGRSWSGLGPDPIQFYFDQTSPPPLGGLPLPLAGQITLPNRHLEYALTWLGLAATLLSVFVAFALKR